MMVGNVEDPLNAGATVTNLGSLGSAVNGTVAGNGNLIGGPDMASGPGFSPLQQGIVGSHLDLNTWTMSIGLSRTARRTIRTAGTTWLPDGVVVATARMTPT